VNGALPITAIIASHNEADLLAERLPELVFCREILVVDLESNDGTAAVAAAAGPGVRLLRRPLAPIVELVRAEVAGEAAEDWLLLIDPDESVPPALAADVRRVFASLPPRVGAVDCPWQFWFRGSPLRGTVWGGISRKRVLVRRDAVDLPLTVHARIQLRPGYELRSIDYTGDNAIAHHWAPGYRALVAKHVRYLRHEGRARAGLGLVTGYRDILRTPWRGFAESFVARRGFRDGGRGLLLSVLWASYSTAAQVALLRELRRA
jgi:hypothetical protein